jgi:hypothetical protein
LAHDAEQAERSAGLRALARAPSGTRTTPSGPAPGRPARERSWPAPDLGKLHRKACAALVHLPVDEAPRIVIAGLGDAAMIATDVRVFVFKTGAKSGAPFGYKLKAFEYESVLRVALCDTGAGGVVVIHAPLKMSVCPSYWADPRDDAWKARNAIPVDLCATGLADEVAALAKLVSEFQHRDVAPPVLERIAELERRRVVAPGSEREAVGNAAAGDDCPRCGAVLGAGWQFCPACGTPAATHERGTRRGFGL